MRGVCRGGAGKLLLLVKHLDGAGKLLNEVAQLDAYKYVLNSSSTGGCESTSNWETDLVQRIDVGCDGSTGWLQHPAANEKTKNAVDLLRSMDTADKPSIIVCTLGSVHTLLQLLCLASTLSVCYQGGNTPRLPTPRLPNALTPPIRTPPPPIRSQSALLSSESSWTRSNSSSRTPVDARSPPSVSLSRTRRLA